MTTINTIEDLMQVLDDHPQWLEAMRVRLLTRELIDLPRVVANLATSTDQRFDAVDQRFDAVDQRFEAVDRRFDAVDQRFEAVDQRFDAVDRRFDSVDRQIQAIRQDIGPLKAAHARNAAERDAAIIADGVGLRLVRTLSREEIGALLRPEDIAGMPRNERVSFLRADIIMETTNVTGELSYVAVEVSFTIDERDTTRAIRNAELLTRITGRQARAAVAGLRLDDRARGSIDAGDVFWCEIPAESFEAE